MPAREFAANEVEPGVFGMSKLQFSLRNLLLFVAVVAVSLTGADVWRRAQNAEDARAEFERTMAAWQVGVVTKQELIEASENVMEAERRQWFSSSFEQAIVSSHVLRLTEIRESLKLVAMTGFFPSEEAQAATWREVEEVSRLIEEFERLIPVPP
jgi:hypothetical protein